MGTIIKKCRVCNKEFKTLDKIRNNGTVPKGYRPMKCLTCSKQCSKLHLHQIKKNGRSETTNN